MAEEINAILASSKRLCQAVHDAGLRPGTEERLRAVLVFAATKCILDNSYAPWFKEAVVGFSGSFVAMTKLTEDLTARIQPTRPASALPSALAGLDGDGLFRALSALQLPAAAPENVHLEVALVAQRLAQQEIIDQITYVYEQIYYMGNQAVVEDPRTVAGALRKLTLDGIVQKHVKLAAAAARSSASGPAN